MTIERSNSEIIIRVPGNVDTEGLQRLINFLTYREVTAGSKASQEDVDKLAKEANRNWWEENKGRFLKP
ncbi:MAG: hypothetical protein H6562_00185 [Lewinellaceae bacterium]|nr:hypothetical protein [Lewinella sp.]MCB9277302.1 hypothetical protein [Lewinellaceae bacterium]